MLPNRFERGAAQSAVPLKWTFRCQTDAHPAAALT